MSCARGSSWRAPQASAGTSVGPDMTRTPKRGNHELHACLQHWAGQQNCDGEHGKAPPGMDIPLESRTMDARNQRLWKTIGGGGAGLLGWLSRVSDSAHAHTRRRAPKARTIGTTPLLSCS